jgi:hypothetical protein
METMGKFLGHTPNGMGLATTAVLGALLDTLIAKGILNRPDAVDILHHARAALAPDYTITPVTDAMDIVSKLAKRFQDHV